MKIYRLYNPDLKQWIAFNEDRMFDISRNKDKAQIFENAEIALKEACRLENLNKSHKFFNNCQVIEQTFEIINETFTGINVQDRIKIKNDLITLIDTTNNNNGTNICKGLLNVIETLFPTYNLKPFKYIVLIPIQFIDYWYNVDLFNLSPNSYKKMFNFYFVKEKKIAIKMKLILPDIEIILLP
jgi:hypothetical protein